MALIKNKQNCTFPWFEKQLKSCHSSFSEPVGNSSEAMVVDLVLKIVENLYQRREETNEFYVKSEYNVDKSDRE